MINTRSPISRHHRCIIPFLLVILGAQLSAYEQGTYLLLDIRDDAIKADSEGRIIIAASIFKSEAASTAQKIAKDEPKSEFETDLLSFGKSRDLEAATSKILEIEIKDPKDQSSFGESPPQSTGFYFNY